MSKLSSTLLDRVERRLRQHVAQKWPACRAVSIRSRGAFVYVYVQFPEDEQVEPLFRLRYIGSSTEWEWAYYSWSVGGRGTYEDSVLDSGSPFGTPEQCFDCAARFLLPAS